MFKILQKGADELIYKAFRRVPLDLDTPPRQLQKHYYLLSIAPKNLKNPETAPRQVQKHYYLLPKCIENSENLHTAPRLLQKHCYLLSKCIENSENPQTVPIEPIQSELNLKKKIHDSMLFKMIQFLSIRFIWIQLNEI